MKWLRPPFILALFIITPAAALAAPVRSVELGATASWIAQVLNFHAGPAGGSGFDLLVQSGDSVRAGQKIAVQMDTRKRIVLEYTARAPGRVSIRERLDGKAPGGTVLEIHVGDAGPCTGGDCGLSSAR
ncbi:hypothetical protein [Microbulbifer sp. SAOS-129_SWC]|uniref:hypothetical protein n=1 Tax=Microbulbifer sp. SAOS-129_SWC TaxID=3145235 RepID=UPI00321807F2